MGEIIEPAASAAPEETGAGAFPDRLAAHVAAYAPTGFAVLDGGHYDDLPGILRQAGLFGRSLFLDHADVEVERAGPWLVSLAQADDAPDRVFDLVGAKPAAVFWFCGGGEAVLYRHLRTLNLARASRPGRWRPRARPEAPRTTATRPRRSGTGIHACWGRCCLCSMPGSSLGWSDRPMRSRCGLRTMGASGA